MDIKSTNQNTVKFIKDEKINKSLNKGVEELNQAISKYVRVLAESKINSTETELLKEFKKQLDEATKSGKEKVETYRKNKAAHERQQAKAAEYAKKAKEEENNLFNGI
jgi:hypothetical protein